MSEVKKNVLLFFLLALLNLPLLFVALTFSLVRPVVNIDYIFVLALFVFGLRSLGLLLLLVAFLADGLSLMAQLFPFFRFDELIYISKFLLIAPAVYQVSAFLLVLWLVFMLILNGVVAKHGSKVGLLSAFVLFGGCFAASAIVSGARANYRTPPEYFAASQVDFFFLGRVSAFFERVHEGQAGFTDYNGGRAVSPWTEGGGHMLSDKLMLIVAESWGVPKKIPIQLELLKPLISLETHDIEIGTVGFSGSTVEAEVKELCSVYPSTYDLRSLPGDVAGECLPNTLSGLGYSTMSIHGASSTMYDRYKWYPDIGFQQSIFFESRQWPRRCYSFPGACDIDLLGEVESFFIKNGKGFFYWLTLNSHSPYDERDIKFFLFDCEKHAIKSDEVCRSLKIHAQFFYSLGELLSSQAMKDVDVIIVGDHEPRIFDRDEFEQYFEAGVVPWVRVKAD